MYVSNLGKNLGYVAGSTFFSCASPVHAQHGVCFYLRDITVYSSTDMEEWMCTEASECAEAMWGVCDSTKCK